ncbi:UNVERIFIED_CONTAM: hypothetical protein RMT77_013537 [Armadillidium vulgare]
MWRRRSSGNDDSTEEMSIIVDEETFAEPGTSFEVGLPVAKKRRRRDTEDKSLLKTVSSDASFCIGEFESEGESIEFQVLTLQEQLFSSLIENHNLADQVKKLRLLVGASEDLSDKLERERERNKILSERLGEYENNRRKVFSEPEHERNVSSKIPRSPVRGRFGWRKRGLSKSKSLDQSEFMSFNSDEDEKEVAHEKGRRPSMPLSGGFTLTEGEKVQPEPQTPVSKISSTSVSGIFVYIRMLILGKIKDFLDNFTEISDDTSSTPVKEEPLTVKKLRENVVRFSASIKPLNDLFNWFITLFQWKSPAATFLSFVIYISAVVYGYFISLILFIFIFHLTKNYIKKRGFGLKLIKHSKHPEGVEEEGNDSKFGDKFVVVFQVARRVQNVLGNISDTTEKIKNLFHWEHNATRQLYLILWVMLLCSFVFNSSQLATISAIYMGIKFFIIDFIFYKFPKIRRKYDSTTELWNSLPTDADLEKKNEKNGASASDVGYFLDLFSLPPTEIPIQGWQSGKRCTLINRDKSLTSAFRNGRLYLTNSYLCFERSRSHSEKNIKINLGEIVSIEKANSYPWIPGGGMAIEIMTENGKSFYFGAILSRDEIFDTILESCRKSGNMLKKKEKEKEKEKSKEKERDKEFEKDSRGKDKEEEKDDGDNISSQQNLNELNGEGCQISHQSDTPIDHDKKMNFLEFID